MSKEEDQAKIAALLEEKRGYVIRGLDDRAAAVDAELRRLGAAGAVPAKRASKRVTKADESR